VSERASEPAEWARLHWDALLRAPGWILDLACGSGRNAAPLARARGRVVGIDRDPEALHVLLLQAPAACVRADLEAGGGIPLASGTCGAVLVFRFLFRPLAAEIERVLAPGGLLLYETFTQRQRDLGHGPRNPAFLLAPGELCALFPALEPLAYDEGLREGERPSATARLAARKPLAV
jgi:SAM-dependent methyltransferase